MVVDRVAQPPRIVPAARTANRVRIDQSLPARIDEL
jgi:hypothetical protein